MIESHTIHDARIVQQSQDADGENEMFCMAFLNIRVFMDDFDLTDFMT